MCAGLLISGSSNGGSRAQEGGSPITRGFAVVCNPRGEEPGAEAGLRGRIRRAVAAGARYLVLSERPSAPPGDGFPLGELARAERAWVVATTPVGGDSPTDFSMETLAFDDDGLVAARTRKVMLRVGSAEGAATRGSPGDIVHTVDDRGLRLGFVSGDDLAFRIHAFADLGADVVLVTDHWSPESAAERDREARELSRKYEVALVIASCLDPRDPVSSGGVYDPEGRLVSSGAGDGVAVALLTTRRPDSRRLSVLGLPGSIPEPPGAWSSPAVAELGRRLFVDPKLSKDGRVACATCHQPHNAFTSGSPTGIGVFGRVGNRNVPSLLNVAFRPMLRWTGEWLTIEEFTKFPLSGFGEMDLHVSDEALPYIRSQPAYREAFRSAVGVERIDFEHVERALASYERTLISGDSPFDRYYYGRDGSALSDAAQRGFGLFTAKDGCARCHAIGTRHALFSDLEKHSLDGSSPPVVTPSLRNAAETMPYLHDGSRTTLEGAIDAHRPGGHVRRLSADEERDLVAFLRSLSGRQRYAPDGRPVTQMVENPLPAALGRP